MEKLIIIGLLIFSVKCFSMDGIEVVYNPKAKTIVFEECPMGRFSNGGFYIVVEGVRRTNCVRRYPESGRRNANPVKNDMLLNVQNEIANAEALDQKIKIFFPTDSNKDLVFTKIDNVQTELKKCEADRDLYRSIAQIMSTNGAGKTESTIEAVADYMSSSAPKSDAKGE